MFLKMSVLPSRREFKPGDAKPYLSSFKNATYVSRPKEDLDWGYQALKISILRVSPFSLLASVGNKLKTFKAVEVELSYCSL